MLEIAPVAAFVVSLLAVYLLYFRYRGKFLNPEDSYWNTVRRILFPKLDILFDYVNEEYLPEDENLYAVNNTYDSEYVATVEADTYYDLAHWLDEMGYARNIISGLKNRGTDEEPDYELSSWAKRNSDTRPDALATYQTHLFIFENEDGSYEIYAHHEYSSLWPPVAYKHYRGIDMDHEKGVQIVYDDINSIESDNVHIIKERQTVSE